MVVNPTDYAIAKADKSAGLPGLEKAARRIVATDCARERERARLREIASDIRADIERTRHACARSREWAMLPVEHRMALLMLAGVDGDLGALARKAWPEFTPDERVSLQVAIRSLAASLQAAAALRVRAG